MIWLPHDAEQEHILGEGAGSTVQKPGTGRPWLVSVAALRYLGRPPSCWGNRAGGSRARCREILNEDGHSERLAHGMRCAASFECPLG